MLLAVLILLFISAAGFSASRISYETGYEEILTPPQPYGSRRIKKSCGPVALIARSGFWLR
jgi:hypothetical protein